MENLPFISSFRTSQTNPDLPEGKLNYFKTLQACLTYIPSLSFFIAIGFVLLYLLGLSGLLDKNEPRLLIVAGIAIGTALLHIPLFKLLDDGQLDQVALFLVLINCTSSMTQIFIWQGITWLPLILTAIPALICAAAGVIPGKFRITGFFYGVVCLAIVFLVDDKLSYQRMTVGTSLTQTAAIAIYLMVVVAIAILILLNSQITFRSISSRLAAIFTFIALLSAVATLIIAAIANLYFDRQKAFLELTTSSQVRAEQVGIAINGLLRDVDLTLSDPLMDQFIQTLFNSQVGSGPYQDAYDRIRSYLLRVQSQNSKYQEVLLLDANGKAVFSTINENANRDFSDFTFFHNVKNDINYGVEGNFPKSLDNSSIILLKPFMDSGKFKGTLAVRINFDALKQILSANTGFGNTAETYLVALNNGAMIPLSNTRKYITKMNTRPAEQALMEHAKQGFGSWDNYLGTPVFGSYVRIPTLQAVLISEIEQREVIQKTINITLTNAIIGLFTLLLTFTIVQITSRSIGLPIVDMAKKAITLANGDLSVRMQVSRTDEIGILASGFNSMASELEAMVKNLENKVEERTSELQKQSNYLRVAAEVARDATSAQSLEELLNRAAQLVLDRFNFYHTGIFLIDENKEFAVLRASPTEAGLQMLARSHRLRIGQVGIVGNVASTGLPRIALDTGQDTAYFNNPLLPNTHSEMALPLKVGNDMVGVLDVQSDQRNAFAQDDINTLQIMADQLALAIQRVRLSQSQEENLHQLESAYQQFTLNSWSKIGKKTDLNPGYSFDGMHLIPISGLPAKVQDSIGRGQSVIIPASENETQFSTLAVPIKLRNQVIGVLTIKFSTPTIKASTIQLAEETGALLANALENARLYTETQKAAQRERTVSQITSKIRSTNDPNEMIRIALEELKQTLRVNDARIMPYTPPQKPGES